MIHVPVGRKSRNQMEPTSQHLSTGNLTPLFEVPETHLQGGSRSRPGFQGSSHRIELFFQPTILVMHSMQSLAHDTSGQAGQADGELSWNFTTSVKKCQVCAAVLVATAVLGAVLFAMRPCRMENFPRNKKLLVKNNGIPFHSVFERNVCLGITQVCEFFISVQNASHSQHPGMCAGQV